MKYSNAIIGIAAPRTTIISSYNVPPINGMKSIAVCPIVTRYIA